MAAGRRQTSGNFSNKLYVSSSRALSDLLITNWKFVRRQ